MPIDGGVIELRMVNLEGKAAIGLRLYLLESATIILVSIFPKDPIQP
jgi:hypothetical protein